MAINSKLKTFLGIKIASIKSTPVTVINGVSIVDINQKFELEANARDGININNKFIIFFILISRHTKH